MKISWVIIFSFIFSNVAKAQTQVGDKIYWTALERYTLSLDSLVKSGSKKVIYLEQRGSYIDSIPTSINGYQIVPLTNANIFKIYKEHNNGLTQTYISPVQVKDDMLEIVFILFAGSLKGRKFFLSNGGGTTIYFKLNNSTKQFEFYKLQIGGI